MSDAGHDAGTGKRCEKKKAEPILNGHLNAPRRAAPLGRAHGTRGIEYIDHVGVMIDALERCSDHLLGPDDR